MDKLGLEISGFVFFGIFAFTLISINDAYYWNEARTISDNFPEYQYNFKLTEIIPYDNNDYKEIGYYLVIFTGSDDNFSSNYKSVATVFKDGTYIITNSKSCSENKICDFLQTGRPTSLLLYCTDFSRVIAVKQVSTENKFEIVRCTDQIEIPEKMNMVSEFYGN